MTRVSVLIPVKNEKDEFLMEDGCMKVIRFPVAKVVKLISIDTDGNPNGEQITLLYEEIEALHKLINQ
jgi:hypothetical protein